MSLSNFTNLAVLTLPDATELTDEMCMDCENLTTFNGPNVEEISAYCFANCQKLTNIEIPNVSSIENSGFKNSGINSDKVHEMFSENLKYIGTYAFGECANISILNISYDIQIDTYAFAYCPNLSIVNLSVSFNNYTLKPIGAFFGCSNLNSVQIRENNKIYEKMFYDCGFGKISTFNAGTGTCFINPSNFDNIEIHSEAFANNNNLTDIELENVSLSTNAFANCSNLRNISIINNSQSVNLTGAELNSIRNLSISSKEIKGLQGSFDNCNVSLYGVQTMTVSSIDLPSNNVYLNNVSLNAVKPIIYNDDNDYKLLNISVFPPITEIPDSFFGYRTIQNPNELFENVTTISYADTFSKLKLGEKNVYFPSISYVNLSSFNNNSVNNIIIGDINNVVTISFTNQVVNISSLTINCSNDIDLSVTLNSNYLALNTKGLLNMKFIANAITASISALEYSQYNSMLFNITKVIYIDGPLLDKLFYKFTDLSCIYINTSNILNALSCNPTENNQTLTIINRSTDQITDLCNSALMNRNLSQVNFESGGSLEKIINISSYALSGVGNIDLMHCLNIQRIESYAFQNTTFDGDNVINANNLVYIGDNAFSGLNAIGNGTALRFISPIISLSSSQTCVTTKPNNIDPSGSFSAKYSGSDTNSSITIDKSANVYNRFNLTNYETVTFVNMPSDTINNVTLANSDTVSYTASDKGNISIDNINCFAGNLTSFKGYDTIYINGMRNLKQRVIDCYGSNVSVDNIPSSSFILQNVSDLSIPYNNDDDPQLTIGISNISLITLTNLSTGSDPTYQLFNLLDSSVNINSDKIYGSIDGLNLCNYFFKEIRDGVNSDDVLNNPSTITNYWCYDIRKEDLNNISYLGTDRITISNMSISNYLKSMSGESITVSFVETVPAVWFPSPYATQSSEPQIIAYNYPNNVSYYTLFKNTKIEISGTNTLKNVMFNFNNNNKQITFELQDVLSNIGFITITKQ